MFVWHQDLESVDVPVQRVLRLQRSLSEVQVALPGLPSQEATAYLCVFAAGSGVRVAVALHLHASRRIAFYLNGEGEVSQQEAGRIMNEGIRFAESMGFILGDLEFQSLSLEARLALWESLPLKGEKTAAPARPEKGVASQESPPPSPRRQPEAPTRRSPASPAALRVRGERLRQNLGRFLASF